MTAGSITPLFDRTRMTRPQTLTAPAPNRELATLCCKLAEAIADAADADQWAIEVTGVRDTGPADFEEWLPRNLLQRMNDRRPAAYRLTLVLQHEGNDLGIIRLGTIRPCGFCAEDVALAHVESDYAASMLDNAMHVARPLALAS